ncbi:hypothetical protein UFOVP67_50 [uncultured Caudovirales phage]|uniref:Uncharacterized protein n=1 Tax=uncultured Caudovirales phage TaxID=2100421 RepID=A0A6J5TAV3_9CAUD|nr:hypothetical protein UFOVP67_50 [uncultured Caudovirales phage]
MIQKRTTVKEWWKDPVVMGDKQLEVFRQLLLAIKAIKDSNKVGISHGGTEFHREVRKSHKSEY